MNRPCPACAAATIGLFCVGCWAHPAWPWWLTRKLTRGNAGNRAAAVAEGVQLIRAATRGARNA